TGVVDFANAGMWPMGGAWLSQHLWDRYLYSCDLNYLRSVYPVLKSAAQFYEDFLIEEPTHHWLVVSPSMSPENIPQGHQGSALAAGNTMDNQLMFDLFTKTRKAAQILKTDADKIPVWNTIISKLPP
ncbi:glycosyl hydrolase family 95 catalytic domain-containing protein, partial [Acinetobacter baumannii]|uniref:glycosyl hydrolase family 95 catalytic domain-containing protein n=1 Tax=Acinetobacter baumannii TaxID=470 RepID=UPI00375836AC